MISRLIDSGHWDIWTKYNRRFLESQRISQFTTCWSYEMIEIAQNGVSVLKLAAFTSVQKVFHNFGITHFFSSLPTPWQLTTYGFPFVESEIYVLSTSLTETTHLASLLLLLLIWFLSLNLCNSVFPLYVTVNIWTCPAIYLSQCVRFCTVPMSHRGPCSLTHIGLFQMFCSCTEQYGLRLTGRQAAN